MSDIWQQMVGKYFVYKTVSLSKTEEFQKLGWVDTDWWIQRIGKGEFSRELALGAAIRSCAEGVFDLYARVECPTCKTECFYKENPKEPHIISDLETTGKACPYCYSHVVVAEGRGIEWVFKLNDSLIKDQAIYFSEPDEMQDLRSESIFKRTLRWMGFK